MFKNAIDWLSRPSGRLAKVFGDRPVGVIGASPGGFGTILAQNGRLPVLRTLGTRTWFGGRLQVSRAGNVFNPAGELTDEAVRTQMRNYIGRLRRFHPQQSARRLKSSGPAAAGTMPAWAHTDYWLVPVGLVFVTVAGDRRVTLRCRNRQ